MSNKKNISYVGRDFPELKETLLNYVKQYYPDYFNSINDYTTEMMLIELMSVIGDINNFYIDDRFREMFIQHAEEPESVFRNAKELGYRPKTVSVATGNVTVSQIVPSILSGSVYIPDTNFCAKIPAGSIFTNNINTLQYRSIYKEDMKEYTTSEIDTEDVSNNPLTFRIFKDIPVRSGINKTKNLVFTTPVPYASVLLDSDVAFVESVVDSSGNKWFEVDYLAQDIIFEGVENTDINSKTQLKLVAKEVHRRFTVEHMSDGVAYLKFGSGTDDNNETLAKQLQRRQVLNSNEIASQNFSGVTIMTDYLSDMAYGIIPTQTTLTVNYVVSTGDKENAKRNSVTSIARLVPEFSANQTITTLIRNSFLVNNNAPITGGQFLNNIEKIRREASDSYLSQNRCVTMQDYILRAKVLPVQYGRVDKVALIKDEQDDDLSMFVISRTDENKLISCDKTTKENLKLYLDRFKMITDNITIYDAKIINFSIKFEAVSRTGYDKNQVKLDVCKKIEEFFHIDNWDINQPIVIEDLRRKMYEVNGILSISKLEFINKTGIGYSDSSYDLNDSKNKKDDVIYPPYDVGIFELKYPNDDIEGVVK